MGCFSSKSKGSGVARGDRADARNKSPFTPPKWKSDVPITQSELERKREEFWDTAPHYGGDRVIWDALKAAAAADAETAKLICESAGIIVGPPNMTVCYDERGAKYDLPPYVLSAPSNLSRDVAETVNAQPAFQASHATPEELMGR